MSKPMLKNGAADATEAKLTVSAAEMGARQREISVSEFFTKNRHLLGFDNPRKALLTCVKEAVDNALDACEEAGILPEVVVKLEVASNGDAAPPPSQANRFRVTVIDYGPVQLGDAEATLPQRSLTFMTEDPNVCLGTQGGVSSGAGGLLMLDFLPTRRYNRVLFTDYQSATFVVAP